MGAIQDKIDEILGIGTNKVSKAKLKELAELQNSTYNAIKTIVSNVRTSGTGAPGTTDTYTITYSDGTTSTFTVANGANGTGATLVGTTGQSTGDVMHQKAVTENIADVGYQYKGTVIPTLKEAFYYVNSAGIRTYTASNAYYCDTILIPIGAKKITFVGVLQATNGYYAFIDSENNVIKVVKIAASGDVTDYIPSEAVKLITSRYYDQTQLVTYENLVKEQFNDYKSSNDSTVQSITNNLSDYTFLSMGTLNSTKQEMLYVNSAGGFSNSGMSTYLLDKVVIPSGCKRITFVALVIATKGNYAFYDINDVLISVYVSQTATISSLVPSNAAYLYVTRYYNQTQLVSYEVLVKDQFVSNKVISDSNISLKSAGTSYSFGRSIRGDGTISNGILETSHVRLYFVAPGEKYFISTLLGYTGTVETKIAYGFYKNTEFSTTTFISSGEIATNGSITLTDFAVTIPANCTILLIAYDDISKLNLKKQLPINSSEIYSLSTSLKYSKDIVLIGDSLTAMGSGYSNYINFNYYHSMWTFGVGGEWSKGIMGRLGAIPFQLSSDVVIPSDTSTVTIPIVSSWGGSVGSLGSMLYGVNPCYIRGIKGTITMVDGILKFARLEAGTSIVAKSGECIETDSEKLLMDCILIMWMGANGGYSDFPDLLHQYKVLAEKCKSKRYIFISAHLPATTSDDFELSMRQEFGNKYINMRNWCVKYGLEESGITPTTADTNAIALGNCPPSLLVDGTHFVTSAKTAQAALIKRKMKELGYII